MSPENKIETAEETAALPLRTEGDADQAETAPAGQEPQDSLDVEESDAADVANPATGTDEPAAT